MSKKDKEIVEQIVEILQMPGEELTDGECIDKIIEVIKSQYKINYWGTR